MKPFSKMMMLAKQAAGNYQSVWEEQRDANQSNSRNKTRTTTESDLVAKQKKVQKRRAKKGYR